MAQVLLCRRLFLAVSGWGRVGRGIILRWRVSRYTIPEYAGMLRFGAVIRLADRANPRPRNRIDVIDVSSGLHLIQIPDSKDVW
jgi:hypothetical protein